MSTTQQDFEKLNRLRVNAGKPELKSWKASAAKLAEAITGFESKGFTDALHGADVETKPETTDPEIAAVLESEPPKPLSESALAQNVSKPAPKDTPKATRGRASLARGLDTDSYARHSRERVRDNREAEKKENAEKKAKLTPADKKQIKDEAEKRQSNIAGAVDPKKEPAKAKRQAEKVAAKQKARAESGKKPKEKNDNEITVADIARDLKIDPKVARAKLRRHEEKLSKLHTKDQDRWTFPVSARAEIEKILK